jgi:predicted PurR-regulated permease PerM
VAVVGLLVVQRLVPSDRREEHNDVAGFIYAVLGVAYVGGVITVSFTYLFGLKSSVAHALMVAALTLLICGILFTIAEFDNPFSGIIEIRPDAFKETLSSFGGT